MTKPPKKSPYYYKEYLKDVLVKSGFSEIYGYAFMSELDLKVLGTDSSDLLEVANPIQPENKFLRRSLIPGLLKVVAKNPTFDPILIFEIGHGFTKEEETVFLSVATAGKNAKKEIETVIENISILTGVAKSSFEIREHTRDELERFKIKKPLIFTSEINVQLLVDGLIKNNVYPDFVIVTKKIHYRSISKYPSLTRDLAFIVDTMVNPDEIIDEIYSASDQICRVELFDEFSSDKFGTNKKNVAFHLYIQNMNKTMTDSEANQIIKKVIQSITDKFKASLREY
ncbi:MAG: hypothetical protein NTW50_03550 [Candidatus Berkelbacteria bacterium]|nr:hypothetical protein [Candidatus Berkelbacteria bacterium]